MHMWLLCMLTYTRAIVEACPTSPVILRILRCRCRLLQVATSSFVHSSPRMADKSRPSELKSSCISVLNRLQSKQSISVYAPLPARVGIKECEVKKLNTKQKLRKYRPKSRLTAVCCWTTYLVIVRPSEFCRDRTSFATSRWVDRMSVNGVATAYSAASSAESLDVYLTAYSCRR